MPWQPARKLRHATRGDQGTTGPTRKAVETERCQTGHCPLASTATATNDQSEQSAHCAALCSTLCGWQPQGPQTRRQQQPPPFPPPSGRSMPDKAARAAGHLIAARAWCPCAGHHSWRRPTVCVHAAGWAPPNRARPVVTHRCGCPARNAMDRGAWCTGDTGHTKQPTATDGAGQLVKAGPLLNLIQTAGEGRLLCEHCWLHTISCNWPEPERGLGS